MVPTPTWRSRPGTTQAAERQQPADQQEPYARNERAGGAAAMRIALEAGNRTDQTAERGYREQDGDRQQGPEA